MSGSISSSDFSETEDCHYTFTSPAEQDRLLKNSNIFKQSRESGSVKNSCAKHPSKKAKYYIAHDRRSLFCSKCALTLALKGIKIEETQETQLEIQRQHRLNQFQEQLRLSLESCQLRIQELSTLETSNQASIEEQRENYNSFFESVIATANQLRQTYLSKFEQDSHNFTNQIQEARGSVISLEKQLRQFQQDVERNHENIVKRMDMRPFEEIMTRYEKRVTQAKAQLQEATISLQPRTLTFEVSQVLAYMNRMCYNLLLKNEGNEARSVKQSHSDNCPSIDMKVFEILEGEDIYQSTYSNPIKEGQQLPTQSPIRIPHVRKGHSNPLSTIQNSRRESHANTPESWQQRTCIQKVLQTNTPNNERETMSHNVSVNEQPASTQNQTQQLHSAQLLQQQQTQQKLIIEVSHRYQEKQKTSTDVEAKQSPIIENLSQINQMEKSFEDRESKELTPKHQKHISSCSGPQTFKLNSNHQTQRSHFQYPTFDQKQKGQYDSNKSLTPHHTQSQQQLQTEQRLGVVHRQQDSTASRRSNSKFSKQPSLDQNDGKRQFILQNIAQYTTQPSNEESLKDRIFKELCSHPGGESVYSQVLKLNNQQKQQQRKIVNKENSGEYGSTIRGKHILGRK